MIEKIIKSETRQFKVVFPNTLNDHDTLFGGTIMQWMDEIAYIAATRFVRKKMVTVFVDKVHFILPIKIGNIIEIIASVQKIKNVKIEIFVEIFIEDKYSARREKAVDALFTFAAIDENNNPIFIGITKCESSYD